MVNISAGTEVTLGESRTVGDCIEKFADRDAIIVTGAVINKSVGNDLVVTVIATGLGSINSQTNSELKRVQVKEITEREPLPLSDAARSLLENPPSVEKKITEIVKEEKEDDYLDIPSFVRTQLD